MSDGSFSLVEAADAWLEGSPEQDGAATLDSMVEQHGLVPVLTHLMTAYPNQAERIAKRVWRASCLEWRKRPIRGIGMYYYRVRNGGIERVVSKLSFLLSEMGYGVVLFTDEHPSPADYPIAPGVARVVLPEPGGPGRLRAWQDGLADHAVDVMVSHAWVSESLLWDALAVKGSGVAYVQHTHGVFTSMLHEESPVLNALFYQLPPVYRLFDAVLSLSAVDAAFWSRFVRRSFFIQNPFSFSAPSGGQHPGMKGCVLWMARFSHQKQPLEAVEIFAHVAAKDSQAKLVMAGGEDPGYNYAQQVRRRVRELGLQDRVELCGFQADVEKYYGQASVFLLTSRYEGAPMAIMESKQHGLPLVAYRLPYLEVMRSPQGMIIVEQGDRRGAAEAVLSLLGDPESRERLGREAKRSAEEYAERDIAADWRRILDALGQPAPSAQGEEETAVLETLLDACSPFFAARKERFLAGPLPVRKARGFLRHARNLGVVGACAHLLKRALKRGV